MAKDKDYIKLIHTARWVRLRHDILMDHPLCERCEAEDIIAPATEVHHRVPDPKNLCALCHDCHVKVHMEMGRSGKEATKRRNAEQVKRMIVKFFNTE